MFSVVWVLRGRRDVSVAENKEHVEPRKDVCSLVYYEERTVSTEDEYSLRSQNEFQQNFLFVA
jgi:hypothetical protein